jgi:hypothetical protein
MKFQTYLQSVIIGTVLLVPAVVEAACSQADIAGNWQAVSSGYGNGRFYRAECTVSVASNGSLSASNCSNTLGQAGTMSNARLTLSSKANCTYRGSFIWFNTLHQIEQLTLAGDRRAANGNGTLEKGHFTFVMTRAGR